MNGLLADPNLNKFIGSLGLTYDVIGILILFFRQIDTNREVFPGAEPSFVLAQGNDDPLEAEGRTKKYENYVRWTKDGQILIVSGFLLQLVSLWVDRFQN